MSKRSQALPRAERVRRRPEFEHAYNSGVRIHGRVMTVFATPNGRDYSRLGVAATRKLGSAVLRNRAKRLAREVFRHHKMVAAGLDIVIVPRRELLDAPFTNLEHDYLATLERRAQARPQPPRARSRGRGARPASRV